ncbi:ABC transporter ATP-binding protein [Proteiniborus sp. MB09-C3]|uniref:ATP-binding cassette domain-containing protein n=1 Tax=Proteiniborus sp. MB09-C3 TaxID=3050072 RepID=UPI002553877E|nr:ABC transporter ATP-binding protein [Proteiniborus sp. MB09-C3]WIV13846.1 ABC transporter ATP-binding protein [Proteiniborus sp. MB09-C3]
MKNARIYLKNNIINNILLFLVTVSVGVLSVKNISLIESILDKVIAAANSSELNRNMILFLIASISLFLLNIILSVLKTVTYWKGCTNFIDNTLSKVFSADYVQLFLKKDSSKLWTDINLSTSYICMYYDAFINMIYRVIKLLIYFAVLISIDLYASTIILIVFIINMVIVNKIKKKVQYYQQQFLLSSQNLSSSIVEYIKLIRNIKSKNKEEYFVGKIDENQYKLNDNVIKNSLIQNISGNLINFISNITPILAVTVIIKLSGHSFTSVGNIVSVYLYIPIILAALQDIHSLILQMISSKPYMKSLSDLCEIEPEKSGSVSITDFKKLKIKDLMVTLDDNTSIKFEDLIVNKGDKILISGASGCGKSTFFNILCGFIKNYEGTIEINDIDFRMLNLTDLRKVIGITFQDNRVFNLPFEEAIKLSTDSPIDDVVKVCEIQDIYEHNKSGCINNDKLSGGEKSRINLAQSLIREPKVLLIDESLSALDEEMEIRILNNIINRFKEITIILISHRKASEGFFDKEISFTIQ